MIPQNQKDNSCHYKRGDMIELDDGAMRLTSLSALAANAAYAQGFAAGERKGYRDGVQDEQRRGAERESKLAKLQNALAAAKTSVEGLDADWTNHESGKDNFWGMASENTRNALAALILQRDEARGDA